MPALSLSNLESLHQTLLGEIEDYRQLVMLTQQERVALQSNNLNDLICTVQQKESLLSRLAKWEKTRQQIVTHLAAMLKLPSNVSLIDLLAFCDESIAQKLSALRQELLSLSGQIRRLTQGNQLLLQAEAVRVDATINYLLSDVATGSYHGNSTSRLPVAGHVFNWRV